MSIRLKEESIPFVNEQRILKGFNRTDKKWCREATVSQSTLKRFWRRKEGISQSSFTSICEAIDIAEWSSHVDWEAFKYNIDSSSINQPKDILLPSSYSKADKYIISLRGVGILNTDEIAIINVIIEELENLFKRFKCCFKKIEEFVSPQSELSESKYIISGSGIGLFTNDEAYLVKDTFQTLKSFFANIFITSINPIPEVS